MTRPAALPEPPRVDTSVVDPDVSNPRDEQGRRWWNVTARRIPQADRDVARGVMPTAFAAADRGYFPIGPEADADDDHPTHGVGALAQYCLLLDDQEAAAFQNASNAVTVALDRRVPLVSTPTIDPLDTVPQADTLTYLRSPPDGVWHGQDVTVAVIDQGTNQACRDLLGAELMARRVFVDGDYATRELYEGQYHGCLVAACAIPWGGRIIDAMVSGPDGTASIAVSAAAFKWATDQGADLINYSFGADFVDDGTFEVAMRYCADRGTQMFVAAGNDDLPRMGAPAHLCRVVPAVHGVGAVDQDTDLRAWFSNYERSMTGVAPGVSVAGLWPDGDLCDQVVPVLWDGTSAASPHACRAAAICRTSQRYTGPQVTAALKATLRATRSPGIEQGGGAYSTDAAVARLGGLSTRSAILATV